MLSLHIEDCIKEAVTLLHNDGVISYPTDTLYGLGASPFSSKALSRVLEIKGRPRGKGLPLLLAEARDLERMARVESDLALVLAQAFWPGPLTLVLPAAPEVPDEISGTNGTVGLRVPDHPIPRALAQALGGSIVGTSANPSGGPDPVTAQDVERMLGHKKVDYILDGGPAYRGLPSTVVDLTGPKPRLVRIGALNRESIEEVCGVCLE